jgi:HK97 family phage major capsid protein
MERCAEKLERLPNNADDETVDALRDEFERLEHAAEQAKGEYRYLRSLQVRKLTLSRSDDRRWAASPGMSETRSRALWANEGSDFLPPRAREHMEKQLREDDDPNDLLSEHVIVTSDRAYFRAFSKLYNDPLTGAMLWTPEERDAVRRVKDFEQRSMVLGTPSAGGFLVPYELDPNIILTASYRDPLREISRVVTTAYNEKRFVTSAGATSSWDPEETEVSDDSPVLAQPTVTCKKSQTFVPVSIELYEDSDIAEQIGKVFADSKAAHESLSFTLSQTNGPVGLISAIIAAGGGSVLATATNALASADPYNNLSALPARWRQNAKFMAHASIINGFRQLPKAANIQESLVDDSGPIPRMVGVPVYENSNMDGTFNASAADYMLISGDFQQYVIVDRIGAYLELVPHLFGAAGRPKGQRGFYQHWRVGADVLVPGAFVLSNYSA